MVVRRLTSIPARGRRVLQYAGVIVVVVGAPRPLLGRPSAASRTTPFECAHLQEEEHLMFLSSSSYSSLLFMPHCHFRSIIHLPPRRRPRAALLLSHAAQQDLLSFFSYVVYYVES